MTTGELVAVGVCPPDLEKAEAAASAFLGALGVPLDAPEMVETPARMARAWAEMLAPEGFMPTTFDAADSSGLVLVRDIAFYSLCAHHALPFIGTVDVAYLPSDRILGLSKVARAVQQCARRLQVQEHLTKDVADRLTELLAARAVGVRIRAEHLCMTLRGVQARGAVTVTIAERGAFINDTSLSQMWTSQLGPLG